MTNDAEREAVASFLDEAEGLLRQDRRPEAVAVLEHAVRDHPNSVVLLTRLGSYLRFVMRAEESARILRRALELRPGDREARIQLGRTLAFDAHIFEALEIHRQLLLDHPGDPDLRTELAEDEILMGAPEKALGDLLRIVEDDGGALGKRRTLATALARAGRYREAIVHWEHLLERVPGYFLAWAGLATAYEGLERRADWRHAVGQACAVSMSGAVSNCMRGDLLFHDGHLAEAQAHYQAALSIHPRHYRAHVALGNLHSNLGQPDLASPHFTAAIEIAPWDGMVQGSWAQFEEVWGNHVDLDSLGEAARNVPRSGLSQILGQIWAYLRKDPVRARNWFAFTVEHLPERAYALAELSRLHLEADDTAAALRTSERLVELSPDHGGGWYSLGHAAARNEDVERAVAAFGRAAELHPQEFGTHRAYGGALLKAGRVEEAIVELRRAMELGSDDSIASLLDLALCQAGGDQAGGDQAGGDQAGGDQEARSS